MHGEFLCLLFLKDQYLFFEWAIEAHFTGTGIPSPYNSDKFRFRRAAFFLPEREEQSRTRGHRFRRAAF
jgi:hypothetical protein